VGGVDLSAQLNLGATFTNVPGGTAHWTFTGGTNYSDASGDVEIVITKINANISVTAYDGPYTGSPHGASGSASGIAGVNLSGLLHVASTTYIDVLGGPVSWTFDGDTNYNSASGTVTVKISKVNATINVAGYTGPYDGDAYGATGTATGVGGVNLSAWLNLGVQFTNVPGGIAHWTFTGGINYNDASGDVAIVINKGNQAILFALIGNKTYGDPDFPLIATGGGSGNPVTFVSLTPSVCTVSGNIVHILTAGTCTIRASQAGNSNYNAAPSVDQSFTIGQREGFTSYIGQTLFVTSGNSSTTAQVTLTASVQDPDGLGNIANATVTFKDLLTNKVLASGVKVTLVSNTDTKLGTANTIVTLSSSQYGAQSYLIEVSLGGSYKNTQQTTAPSTDAAYQAAHPTVTVMIPSTTNSTLGAGAVNKTGAAPAGTLGDASSGTYSLGMSYNNKGTNPQGQIQLMLKRADGMYYVKSNSITSVAFVGGKDVTIYTKASIYKIDNSGAQTSIEGNVTLRVDAHDGGSSGDLIGFTVLSSKDSTLFYSNNWVYDSVTRSWKTMPQAPMAMPERGCRFTESRKSPHHLKRSRASRLCFCRTAATTRFDVCRSRETSGIQRLVMSDACNSWKRVASLFVTWESLMSRRVGRRRRYT
jgi:hypothetical protein